MMCRYPGCVAAATVGQVCSVHASGRGTHCDDCGGTGITRKRLNGTPDTCDQCMGTGLIDKRRRAAPKTGKKVPAEQRGLIVLAQDETGGS